MKSVTFVLPPFRGATRPPLPEEKRFWEAQWMRRARTAGWDLRGSLRADERGPVTFDQPEVPLGVIHLAPFLRDGGWEVSVLDLWEAGPGSVKSQVVRDALRESESNVFLFSTFTNNYASAVECMRIIKDQRKDAVCVIGGPHVTGWPHEALFDGFDVVVPGEGDAAMIAFAQHGFSRDAWKHVPSARFLERTGAMVHSQPTPGKPIETTPLPAYDLLPPRFRQAYYARLFTALGCPYRCTFCSDVLWTGIKPRIKSAERIAAELALIRKHVQFHEVYVSDETFTVRKDHALMAARTLHEQGIVWGCETRADLVDEQILVQLADYGCVEIDFGIESLAEPVLRLANKRIFSEKVERALRQTSYAGIRTHVNLMVGLPGETELTARETISTVASWIQEGIVSTVDYFVTVPYPGSAIFDQHGRFGIRLRTRDWSRYREDDLPVYDLPTLTAEQIFSLWREGLERLAEGMECSHVEQTQETAA